ncbi:MAG: hypothetical protein DWQ31_09675 [Planctomycetota bacterium]|nr:MAG: hypothetical protein DWQ31_09675 [Planctomycetota bacterium]
MGDISFEGDNFGNISHFGKLDFEPTQDNRGNTLRPCRFGTLQPVDPGELVYPEFEPVDLWVESPDEASMISLMVRFRGPERDVSSFQRLKGTIQFRHGGRQGDVEIPVSEIQHGLSWDHPTLAAAGVQVRFFAPEGEDTRGQFGVSVSGKLSNYGLGRVMVNGQEVRGCAEHHPPDADGNDISIFTARDGAFAAEAIYRVEVTTEPKDENILVVPFDLNDVPIEQWR